MKRSTEKLFCQKSRITWISKYYKLGHLEENRGATSASIAPQRTSFLKLLSGSGTPERGNAHQDRKLLIANRKKRLVAFYSSWLKIKISFALFLLIHSSVQAVVVPPRYRKILDEGGIQVYKGVNRNFELAKNWQKEYITVIDTRKASIKNLTGKVIGTDNAKVSKKLLTDFWQDAIAQNTASHKAKVIVNGAFFSTNDNPTGIAFGLKTDNNLITYGYAIGKEYPGQIRIFAFKPFSGIASIQNYTKELFSLFPEVLGALHPLANKSAQKYLPRTFIGVSDRDKNGTQESVVLYSSNYARQIDATKVLRNFGCNAMAMLDGGGSTGLIVNGQYKISTNRPIPHAIAVYAAQSSSSK